MTEKVVFLSGFYGLLVLKKKDLRMELKRFSEDVFEVWSISVVLVSSSIMFFFCFFSGLVPISTFFTEQ